MWSCQPRRSAHLSGLIARSEVNGHIRPSDDLTRRPTQRRRTPSIPRHTPSSSLSHVMTLLRVAQPSNFPLSITVLSLVWFGWTPGSAVSDGLTAAHAFPSLLLPFSVDYESLLRVRRDNIGKWREYHHRNIEYSELGVDRRSNLSLEEFWDIYDGKWPVIITDVVDKWPAYNWTGDFLTGRYGHDHVIIKAVDLYLDAAIGRVFADAYDMFEDKSDQGSLSQAISLSVPLYRFYENTDHAHPKSWTYLEDELFIPMRPELRKDIGHTVYGDEDFFELFPEDIRPWNAMLLWGTKYSRSTLHIDPYNWTGTNVVIRGHKWWKLFPPGQDEYLYIMKDKRSGFPLDCYKYNSAVDAFDPDLKKYPLFKKAVSIMVQQFPGEMLFIPSGWYHQAYNGEETLAISSQLMNRNNFRIVLEEILKVGNTQREFLPSDVDLMTPEQQVQAVLSSLPKQLLQRGRAVTENIIERIKLKNVYNQRKQGGR